MRRLMLAPAVLVCLVFLALPCLAGEKCCECGTTHKLKKVYHPVVTFKEVCYTKYDYCTVCKEVLAPTSSCAKSCECNCTSDCGCGCGDSGLGGKICGYYCDPKTITVPVAVQHKCEKCTRLVPCVTWVVECKCVECCKECDHDSCCPLNCGH